MVRFQFQRPVIWPRFVKERTGRFSFDVLLTMVRLLGRLRRGFNRGRRDSRRLRRLLRSRSRGRPLVNRWFLKRRVSAARP